VSYPSISPVNTLSGVISPTAFGLLASPVATPRTTPRNTPRSTPIPRWCTPFVGLDENMDYALMINLPGCNIEEMLQDSTLFGMLFDLLSLIQEDNEVRSSVIVPAMCHRLVVYLPMDSMEVVQQGLGCPYHHVFTVSLLAPSKHIGLIFPHSAITHFSHFTFTFHISQLMEYVCKYVCNNENMLLTFKV